MGSKLASDVQPLGGSATGPHSPGQNRLQRGLGLRPSASAQAWSCAPSPSHRVFSLGATSPRRWAHTAAAFCGGFLLLYGVSVGETGQWLLCWPRVSPPSAPPCSTRHLGVGQGHKATECLAPPGSRKGALTPAIPAGRTRGHPYLPPAPQVPSSVPWSPCWLLAKPGRSCGTLWQRDVDPEDSSEESSLDTGDHQRGGREAWVSEEGREASPRDTDSSWASVHEEGRKQAG